MLFLLCVSVSPSILAILTEAEGTVKDCELAEVQGLD